MLVALSAADFTDVKLEVLGSFINDLFWCQVLRARLANITDEAFCCCDIRLDTAHLGVGKELIERTLKLTNIGLDVIGQVFNRIAT
ncbi:hypothetical protein D3C86_1701560 [compost metagenome]